MAVRSTPIFTDGLTHPAEAWRLAQQSMLRGTTGSFAGGVAASDPAHGVARTTDLAVTANGTPNMSVNVAAGGAFLRGTQSANQGAYHVWNDATVNLAVAAADATNPRRDLVIVQARDGNYGGSTSDGRVLIVTGTPAASPADPSLSSYPNALVLARLTVTAGKTSIVAGDITDLRTLANRFGMLLPVASTAERDRFMPTPLAGQGVYLDAGDATEGPQFYNGTSWRQPWNQPWGVMGYAQVTANQGSITSLVDLTGLTVTLSTVANRRVRMTFTGYVGSSVANDTCNVALVVGGTQVQSGQIVSTSTAQPQTLTVVSTTVSTTQASIVYKANAQRVGTGAMQLTAGALLPASILVEDIGPAGAPA